MTAAQIDPLDKKPTFDGQVGFIGAGRMASALARGLIASGFIPAQRILASDFSTEARQCFLQATGCRIVESNADLLSSEVLFLAVKPQQLPGVLDELKGRIGRSTLLVSIAAGVRIATITGIVGDEVRLVRVMPNTPCLVAAGASAYTLGGAATIADGELVRKMLQTVGIAITVPEDLLDAVTGLSGSGPAYVYQIIEALSDGGVLAGLPRDAAMRLAAQTVMGAAKMVLETGEHPGALKDAVTSPGGTTITGLHELERAGLRAALMNAVTAATERSKELGR